jgi:hypothetical protein
MTIFTYPSDDVFYVDFENYLKKSRVYLLFICPNLYEDFSYSFQSIKKAPSYENIKLFLNNASLYNNDPVVFEIEKKLLIFLYENQIECLRNYFLMKIETPNLSFMEKHIMKKLINKMEPKESTREQKIKMLNCIIAQTFSYLRSDYLSGKFSPLIVTQFKDEMEIYLNLLHQKVVR